jgi:hypothetical protein
MKPNPIRYLVKIELSINQIIGFPRQGLPQAFCLDSVLIRLLKIMNIVLE